MLTYLFQNVDSLTMYFLLDLEDLLKVKLSYSLSGNISGENLPKYHETNINLITDFVTEVNWYLWFLPCPKVFFRQEKLAVLISS